MGLKLMVEKDDKILIGDDTIITISKLGRRPTLHINAPPDVKLIHISPTGQTILKPKERSLRLLFYCQGGKHGHTQTRTHLRPLPQVRAAHPLRRAITQPPRTVPSNRTLGQGVTEMMTKAEIEAMPFHKKLDKLRRGIVILPPERIQRNLDEENVYEIASQHDQRSVQGGQRRPTTGRRGAAD